VIWGLALSFIIGLPCGAFAFIIFLLKGVRPGISELKWDKKKECWRDGFGFKVIEVRRFGKETGNPFLD
jgi:hypothetical protein